MEATLPYKDFIVRLTLLIKKHPQLMQTTLSNIFSMRLLGNKTHGDLAEVAISEFINQYMYDFRSRHVGKDRFRAKSKEEDIEITNEVTNCRFPISLKAYGHGPLQLSTDKNFGMFPRLEAEEKDIKGRSAVEKVLRDKAFQDMDSLNVLPLIYDEGRKQCNILVFDYDRAARDTYLIAKIDSGGRRKYPVYRFFNSKRTYICEVRYGGPDANALQRGLWTHTRHGQPYFDSVTGGWITYKHNLDLIRLLSHALVSSKRGHVTALVEIMRDIEDIKRGILP